MTVHLSILIWLPARRSALLGALLAGRAARAAASRSLGALVRARPRDRRCSSTSTTGAAACSTSPTTTWIAELGHPLQARRRRAEPVPGRADDAAVRGRGAVVASLRPWERAAAVLLPAGLAETAVLGAFLAQDLALFVLFFDLMLVPFYFLVGQWGRARTACAATIEDGHLHAGRLAADARRRRSRRRCSPRQRRRPHHLRRSPTCSAARSATARRSGSSCPSRAAFLIKMPAFPFHGWMPDGYRDDAAAGAGGVLRRAVEGRAPTASCGSCCRCSRDAAHDFQTLMLLIALRLDPLRLGEAFTQTERAADPRLLVGRAARLHHARDLRAATRRARRARCCRRSTTGSWSRRCSSSSRCWPRAPAARRTSATWAGSRSARRCSRRCS